MSFPCNVPLQWTGVEKYCSTNYALWFGGLRITGLTLQCNFCMTMSAKHCSATSCIGTAFPAALVNCNARWKNSMHWNHVLLGVIAAGKTGITVRANLWLAFFRLFSVWSACCKGIEIIRKIMFVFRTITWWHWLERIKTRLRTVVVFKWVKRFTFIYKTINVARVTCGAVWRFGMDLLCLEIWVIITVIECVPWKFAFNHNAIMPPCCVFLVDSCFNARWT